MSGGGPMDSGMRANEGQVPPAVPLEYAHRSLRPPPTRHSFCSISSLVMAVVAVAWQYCVENGHPRYHQGGPVWAAFAENACWPGGIGLVLALFGLVQPGRKRVLSVLAIVVIAVAYLFIWRPGMSFA